jgi:hypothetical protein
MMIKATTLTSTELSATRAVVDAHLLHFGAALEEAKPELYEALKSTKAKLANLARTREAIVTA